MSTYLFRTPTVEQGKIGRQRLFSHFKQFAKGLTVINQSGTYSTTQFPVDSDLQSYTAYYLGGGEHTGISQAIRDDLIAANIGITSANFTVE